MLRDTRKEKPPMVTASRLQRALGPPLSSVLIRIEWAASEPYTQDLIVHLDGLELSPDLYEMTPVGERTLLLIIRGEAFPWVSSQRSSSRLELFVGTQGVFTENLDVEGFQAA